MATVVEKHAFDQAKAAGRVPYKVADINQVTRLLEPRLLPKELAERLAANGKRVDGSRRLPVSRPHEQAKHAPTTHRDRHVLLAVHHIAHRRRNDAGADRRAEDGVYDRIDGLGGGA